MALPVFGTTTNVGPDLGTVTPFNLNHNGGRILVAYYDTTGTLNPTCTIDSVSLGAPLVSIANNNRGMLRLWGSGVVASGARTIAIPQLPTGAFQNSGLVAACSVANWDGTITTPVLYGPNATFDGSHDVTATVNDLVMGFFAMAYTPQGALGPAGFFNVGAGCTAVLVNGVSPPDNGDPGSLSGPSIGLFRRTTPASGVQTVSCTVTNGVTAPDTHTSCAFALKGTSAPIAVLAAMLDE